MPTIETLAPGIRRDYYDRVYAAEERHFWYVGMRSIAASLLGGRLRLSGQRVLDAGCGTGGFLQWLAARAPVGSLAGVDVGSAALELARGRLPGADLRHASLSSLPFADASFDLVFCNDVLQHVHEDEVQQSLGELRRVLAADGRLVVRTNGSRRVRRNRDDWRAYDRDTLVAELVRAGFACERVTHANMLLSLYSELRRRRPSAPSVERDGIPARPPSRVVSEIGTILLAAEASWLRRSKATLPFGHTIFVLARAR